MKLIEVVNTDVEKDNGKFLKSILVLLGILSFSSAMIQFIIELIQPGTSNDYIFPIAMAVGSISGLYVGLCVQKTRMEKKQ